LPGRGRTGRAGREVTESVKGDDKKGGKEESAANETEQSKMPRSITANTFIAFKKRLTVQRDKQQETLKFLAGLTPQEKYRSCTTGIMSTPEAQKIALEMPTRPDNATAQQLQAYAGKTDKKCGEDPGKYDFNWRRDRFTEARVAAVAAFSAALGSPSGNGGPYLMMPVRRFSDFERRYDTSPLPRARASRLPGTPTASPPVRAAESLPPTLAQDQTPSHPWCNT